MGPSAGTCLIAGISVDGASVLSLLCFRASVWPLQGLRMGAGDRIGNFTMWNNLLHQWYVPYPAVPGYVLLFVFCALLRSCFGIVRRTTNDFSHDVRAYQTYIVFSLERQETNVELLDINKRQPNE